MFHIQWIAEEVKVLHGLRGSAPAFFLARSARRAVVVTSEEKRAVELVAELETFAPTASIFHFPALEGSPLAMTPTHPVTRRARVMALGALSRGTWDYLVTTPRALMQRLAPPDRLLSPCLELVAGEVYDPMKLARQLVEMGYTSVDLVGQPGDFSRRGALLDIYDLAEGKAFRLEFFDEQLDEIRVFDPETQRASGSVEVARILPIAEWVGGEAELKVFARKGGELWNGTPARKALLDLVLQIRDRGSFPGHFHWTGLFFENCQSPLELIARTSPTEPPLFFVEDADACSESLEGYLSQLELQSESLCGSELANAPLRVFFGVDRPQRMQLPPHTTCLLHQQLQLERADFDFVTQTVPHYQNDVKRFLEHWEPQAQRLAIVLVFHSAGIAQRLSDHLHQDGKTVSTLDFPLPDRLEPGFYLCVGQLRTGFFWPERELVLIAESDLFSAARGARPKMGKRLFSSEFRDLKVGDFVVHIDFGVGRFLGLVEMAVGGGLHEMMALEYRDGQKLYVGMSQLENVQRHAGSDAEIALDKMGGTAWTKTKAMAKKAVREMAEELLKLYAARSVARAVPLGSDSQWQSEFEEAFEFEPTEGQLLAMEDIKADLAAGKPLDRLLIGDVGFGKTEVAMRTAFKIAIEGRQVAVLCPTTVLAFQHFHTFTNRFAAFPLRIAWISRFSPPREIKRVLEETAGGSIDILIGTHRLLSADVQFKNLGALIIDEEQRFGVSHKEKLKKMRKQVHVLSMSATPIPRTLGMALNGIRDISVIESPPRNRLAISTTVAESNDKLIRDAIRFELERKGQVFFVHNRVETIDEVAAKLHTLVPEARFRIGHGQMEAEQLEDVMLEFMEHKFDVLVSTTIIENGVDIPNANTLIVNRADMFGMSQLYQLRGRVGRSDRLAFAYLLIPSRKSMTETARKRLAALEEFTELGAGFRIAALDLELRGTGNLLGGEQAGHIDAVGYNLYTRLLKEAIAEIRGEEQEDELHCVLHLQSGASLPRTYLEDTNQRLHYYKRLVGAKTEEELRELWETLADVYGEPPPQAQLFLAEQRLRLFLAQKRVSVCERERERLKLRFHASAPLHAEFLIAKLHAGTGWSATPDGQIQIPLHGKDPLALYEEIKAQVESLLHGAAPLPPTKAERSAELEAKQALKARKPSGRIERPGIKREKN